MSTTPPISSLVDRWKGLNQRLIKIGVSRSDDKTWVFDVWQAGGATTMSFIATTLSLVSLTNG